MIRKHLFFTVGDMRMASHKLMATILQGAWLLMVGLAAFGEEKTVFQTARPWIPALDLRSDVAIVYGVNPSFGERVQSWRERGYGIHMMTGVAWGGYQEYINGEFDGENHMDEGQVERGGEMIMHGPGVPYMVPSESYIEYLKSLIRRAIDEGVSAIHLEEPEFWNRAGYSEGFKREWEAYYEEAWQPQHQSPEATYRSAKLKYHLYFRALKKLFLYAKEYSESKGQRVECYVPTHTLINYSAWQIVSPESSLADLPGMDGYIAQVWTGTARTPVIYQGVERERTFENAFLEYGSMVAMTEPTDRRVYFLTDPIEDNPNHTWEDYKKNYEATFTAQLLYPSIAHYEVMPWPSRIFTGTYPKEGTSERQGIPAPYATEILTLINALNEMPESSNKIPGTQGIGVLLSDTMMFQRFPTHEDYTDPRLSNFYGMALPLIKRGVPVKLVQMENLLQENTLEEIDVLIMSYANMKPLQAEYHQRIGDWVKNGGGLIYIGRDDDSFQRIREWWNQGEYDYQAPSQHLFDILGVEEKEQAVNCGDGVVFIQRMDPKELVMDQGNAGLLSRWAASCLRRLKDQGASVDVWKTKNHFHLRRGAYDIVAVFDESVSEKSYSVEGPVIDLFDPGLRVYEEKSIEPDQRAFLLNLNRVEKEPPCLLASASRASEIHQDEKRFRLTMKGPAETQGIARFLLERKPEKTQASVADGRRIELAPAWDEETKTLLVRYPNHPDGVEIVIERTVTSEVK